jgi:hypothetical protein
MEIDEELPVQITTGSVQFEEQKAKAKAEVSIVNPPTSQIPKFDGSSLIDK